MESLYYVKYEEEHFVEDKIYRHRIVTILDLSLEQAKRIVNSLVDDRETHYLFCDYGPQR